MENPGIISVRTSSSRLPNKCLLPFGESNVIEHIVRRATFYGLSPIICTSTEQSDDIIEEIASKIRIPFFRGSLNNKLTRWRDCCRYFDLEDFHSIDADDPFFDGSLMIESLELLRKGFDLVYPTNSSHNGAATVGFSIKTPIIERACKGIDPSLDTEIMWPYIEKIPGVRKIILPEKNNKPVKVRLTLDYEEDYWLLKSVEKICGALASRDTIDYLFESNPDMHKINWFRNKESKDKQKRKK